MRVSVVIACFLSLLALLGTEAVALAKPKVAVAPLVGDDDDKIGALVVDAANDNATVTSAKTMNKALHALDIKEPDSQTDAKRLRKKLQVDAVIYGKVEHNGSKHKLKLAVYTRGKKPDRFEIEYKQSSSRAFRKELSDELTNRLAPDENGEADDDDATPVRKPKRRHRDEGERSVMTQPLVFVDLGGGAVRRTLTYSRAGAGIAPPRVGTAAVTAQFDGELYAAAVTDAIPAAVGLYVSVARSFGLSIDVPGTALSAPITEGSYTVGLRYRFLFGSSSLALGASYWNQFYIADRGTLMTPMQLNMADTDYKAFAPGALFRFVATPRVNVAVQLDVPLMLATGPITDSQHFGVAKSLAFVAQGSADITFGSTYGLHLALFFDQVGMSFNSASVASATDRTVGGMAAFVVAY